MKADEEPEVVELRQFEDTTDEAEDSAAGCGRLRCGGCDCGCGGGEGRGGSGSSASSDVVEWDRGEGAAAFPPKPSFHFEGFLGMGSGSAGEIVEGFVLVKRAAGMGYMETGSNDLRDDESFEAMDISRASD